MSDYNKFRADTLKLVGKKKFRVTKSYGIRQAWRWLRKNKWLDLGQSITEKELGLIVKAVNKYFVQRLLEGHDILLPCKMGLIEIRKYKAEIKFEDGKIKTNLPIDWKRTLQLWYSDEEARKNKTLVRQEIKEIFRIIYNRQSANYNNKSFYEFSAARGVKRAVSERIRDNKMDAFLMGKYELR